MHGSPASGTANADAFDRRLDGAQMRASRAAVLADRSLCGRSLTRRLADQADGWLISLAGHLPIGWGLAATGGYSRSQLYPMGDIDVVLLHPRMAPSEQVEDLAQRVWYPFWDAGIKISPAAHSDRTLLRLAGDELFTLTSLLEARHVVGDVGLVESVRETALSMWHKQPWAWLERLADANRQRWRAAGDVASLLEPNLKDGRGGLRDLDSLRWALASGCPEVARAFDAPLDDVRVAATTIATVRAELHRVTGRASDILRLHDQDDVAEAAGYGDADEMMLAVSAAARQIEWVSTRFWGRCDERSDDRPGRRRSRRRIVRIRRGVVEAGDEVELSGTADLTDASLTWRAAEAAASHGLRLSRSALVQLANAPFDAAAVWSADMRHAFVGWLGSGPAVLETAEALEHFGLLSRLIPAWSVVRSRPQRNAFHVYTVDRHLLQAVIEANHLVRTVSRPDLLLVAALLHDIGKGHGGDHTAVGVELVVPIARQMGFDDDDVETLRILVETHLLLAETATRRDLDDPRTAELVAERLGSRQRLTILRALTEADSLATGPSCWTSWKAGLVNRLTERAAACFSGATVNPARQTPPPFVAELLELCPAPILNGAIFLDHRVGSEVDTIAVVSADRSGLFSTIAGTLAIHGIEVIAADVWTTEAGVAVDRFHVAGDTPVDVARLNAFLARAIAGQVDVAERISRRMASRSPHRPPLAAAPPRLEVFITNQESTSTTMVEVRSPDGEAVLYRLARVLHQHGLDIVTAKVATLGHEVVDVFYVRRPGEADEAQLPEADHAALSTALAASLQ